MAAITAQGSLVFICTSTAASTSTAGLVGMCKSFSGPGGNSNEIDVTSFDSTAKEFLIGLRDEGTVTFDCNYSQSDAGQQLVRTRRADRALTKLVIKLSDATFIIGDCYVTGYNINGGVDQPVTASVTVRMTGATTFSTALA